MAEIQEEEEENEKVWIREQRGWFFN